MVVFALVVGFGEYDKEPQTPFMLYNFPLNLQLCFPFSDNLVSPKVISKKSFSFALSICATYRGDDASYVPCAACSCASASGLPGAAAGGAGGQSGWPTPLTPGVLRTKKENRKIYYSYPLWNQNPNPDALLRRESQLLWRGAFLAYKVLEFRTMGSLNPNL